MTEVAFTLNEHPRIVGPRRPAAVEHIADWMEATGGLYLED